MLHTDYKSDHLPSRLPFHSNQEVRVSVFTRAHVLKDMRVCLPSRLQTRVELFLLISIGVLSVWNVAYRL